MKRLILDTSIFVNPDSARAFGQTPTQAFINFLERAQKTVDVEFFMPPSIFSELMYFAEEPKIPKNLLLKVQIRPPKKHEIKVPGFLLYNLVETVRDRVDRGLRLAERVTREALQMSPSANLASGGPPNDPKRVRPDAELIGRLRESYRRIMREGMLDSKCDVDLLLLSYEVEGLLVSADQGVLAWADSLGVSTLAHGQLSDFLDQNSSKKIPH